MSFKSDMEKKINSDASSIIKLVNYHLNRDNDAEIIASSIPDNAESIYDPMCGIASVLSICRRRGMKIIASDSNASAVMYARARLSAEPFTEEDIDLLLSAKPKHGYLSKLGSSKYPTSYYSRNYIDGMVDAAWNHPKKDYALGVMSGVLMTMCGNFGTFKQTLDPYSFKSIKTLVRRIAAILNADTTTYKAGDPKPIILLENIKSVSRIPNADAIFVDPPGRDSKYKDRYFNVNSVLMQKAYDMIELSESDILAKLPEYAKHCKTLIVASDMYCKDHLSSKRYVSVRKASVNLWTASDTEMKLYEPLESVSDITKYDPYRARTEAELKRLDEDFRLCEAMHANVISGGDSKYSADAIEATAAKILTYLGSYGKKIDLSNKFSALIAGRIKNGLDLYTTSGVVIDSTSDIEGILNRKKRSISSKPELLSYIDKPVYLCDKERSYAIVRIEGVDLPNNNYSFKVARVFNTPRLLRAVPSGEIINSVEFSDAIDFTEVPKNIDVTELSVVELISLHEDLHSYYNRTLPKDWSPNDVVGIHEMVMAEMSTRNVDHDPADALDKSSSTPTSAMRVKDILAELDKAFPKEIKINNIRCITGALAEKASVADLNSTLGVNSVEIFDAIDGNLSPLDAVNSLNIKHIAGTAPASKFIPVYDAVFTRREKFESVEPEYILDHFKYISPSVPRLAEMTLNDFISVYGSKPLSVEPRLYGVHLIVAINGDECAVYDRHANFIELPDEMVKQFKTLGANPLTLDGFYMSDGTFVISSILRYNSTELAYKVNLDTEHTVFFDMLRETALIKKNNFIHTDNEDDLRATLTSFSSPVVIKHRSSVYSPAEHNPGWIEFSGEHVGQDPLYEFGNIKEVLTFLREE